MGTGQQVQRARHDLSTGDLVDREAVLAYYYNYMVDWAVCCGGYCNADFRLYKAWGEDLR